MNSSARQHRDGTDFISVKQVVCKMQHLHNILKKHNFNQNPLHITKIRVTHTENKKLKLFNWALNICRQ